MFHSHSQLRLSPFSCSSSQQWPSELVYTIDELELPGGILAFGTATIGYDETGDCGIIDVDVTRLIDSDGLPIRIGAFPLDRHIRNALQLTCRDRIQALVWAALPEERWVEEHRLSSRQLGVGRAA